MAMIPAGYKQTDLGVVPEDWDNRQFIDIVDIIDGDRGSNYPSKQDFQPEGYCLFLSASNVTKRGFSLKSCEFITKIKDESLRKGRLKLFDILLTTRGSVGHFAYFDESINFNAIRINSGMVILRNKAKNIDNSYLYVICRSHVLATQIGCLTFGSAQPQLTVKGISSFQIPVPPTKTEQIAIAKASSDAESWVQSLRRLTDKKRLIKQGVMQDLLNPYESGVLKTGWMSKRLGDVCKLINGRGFKPYEWSIDGLPIIRIQNLNGSGDFNHYNGDYDKKIEVHDGQLLFAWSGSRGTSFGPHIWRGKTGLLNYHTWKVVVDVTQVDNDFFLHTLKELTKTIEDSAHGASALVHTQKGEMEGLMLSIPIDISEQIRIATILSDIDKEIAQLEAKLAKAKTLKQGMMQNLLTGKVRLVKPQENADAVS